MFVATWRTYCCFSEIKNHPKFTFFWNLFIYKMPVVSLNKQQMPAYGICHICLPSSAPCLCSYLQDAGPASSTVNPILKHYPPPLCKLTCKNVASPMRFHSIICCPPPPLTSAPPKHHSELWQQVGDFWQVTLISWLGKKSAWQWRTCVRFWDKP